MARQLQAKDTRTPFFLYIDEVQNYVPLPSMTHILNGARKYMLSLTVAHQQLESIGKYDSELLSALITNAGTRICFRLGEQDGKKLEEGFSSFNASDFLNLGIGEAIVRINRSEDDFSLKVQQQAIPENTIETRMHIIDQSRKKYATPIGAIDTAANVGTPVAPLLQPNTPLLEQPETPILHAKGASPVPKIKDGEPIKEVAASEQEKKQETEHRSLQTTIKLIAETHGFKAVLEVPVPGGKVDVVLEQQELRIACEVSSTTDTVWEMKNMRKCLQNSFTHILSISKNEKFIAAMRRKIEKECSAEEQKTISVLSPDAVFEYLESISRKNSSPQNVKGYRIHVRYGEQTADMSETKESLVNRILGMRK
jgi:hypothetical protein